MTASSRMVCLMVFTSKVANVSEAMLGATTTSGVLLKISFSRVLISSRKLSIASPYQHRGSVEDRPGGAGVGDEIARSSRRRR